MDAQRQAAEQRTCFEQAVFRVCAYVAEQKIESPKTFISYAWGVSEQEHWVEKRLGISLGKRLGLGLSWTAGIMRRIGASVPRFIERIEK